MDTRFSNKPGRISQQELTRVRTAAMRATKVHPGPVGELLARELRAYADFGFRFGCDGVMERLAAHLLCAPLSPRLDDMPFLALLRSSAP